MIDAVLVFSLMNVLFEFVLLCMLAPRTRLRVLGSPSKQSLLHVGFLLLNLTIHWGTMVGTMSAVGAFLCSIVTVNIARVTFGYVTENNVYRRGLLGFKREELV